MTITLYWWYLPIILFFAPFVYGFFRERGGQYDFAIDYIMVLFACWAGAIGVLIGHFF